MNEKLASSIKFDVQGSNIIGQVKLKGERVYINENQFFDGIKTSKWLFPLRRLSGFRKMAKKQKEQRIKKRRN